MSVVRRQVFKDATWARAWTVDLLAELPLIPDPRHGDVAFCNEDGKWHSFRDDGTWPADGGSAPPSGGGIGGAAMPFPAYEPEEQDYFSLVPGPKGDTGPAGSGAAGAPGSVGPPGLDGYDGEDGLMGPPGPSTPGAAGATGAAGAPGPPGPPGLDAEEPEVVFPIPGVQGRDGASGAAGAAGAAGPPGPPGLDAEEPEIALPIPGPVGPQGATGAGGGPTLISGNSGAANSAAAPSETWQVLTANAATNSTTTIAIVMTTTGVAAGTYFFRYDILVQSAATTTAVKFSIDFTGTVTNIQWHLFYPSAGVTAATGVADQEINVTTGAVWAHESTRIDNTTLGPMTDMDTANANVHMVAEGILRCSTSGSLTLGHASEVAAASTVQAGTLLVLKRFI